MNVLLFILGLVPIWQQMDHVVVVQDSAITQLMENHWQGRVQDEIETAGWRVQIYSSNNQLVAKQEAEALKEKLENELTEPVYVDFIQPFWKVRIGNFLTMDEAKSYLSQLIKIHPELQAESYPVRDQIKLKKQP